MNFAYYEHHREEDIVASLSKMAFGLARLRLALLRKLGWRGLISFKQQRALLKDVFRGLFLVPFHGTKLRGKQAGAPDVLVARDGVGGQEFRC